MVAALDWGLGHATRCLPVIAELERQGAEVHLASAGRAAALWRAERPDLPLYDLPPYAVRYATGNMVRNFLPQLPHLVRTVRAEHRALDRLITAHRLDAVISDNRYGCYSRRVPSVFITHQLRIQMPAPWPSAPANWVNHRLIRRFDQCWVPDYAEAPGLAGALAHGPNLPPATYVGLLSRLQAVKVPQRYRWLALLSGPEPQRTYLERAISQQAATANGPALIIGGHPGGGRPSALPDHVEYRPFETGQALAEAIAASEVVVCRSGYSTLMDLAVFGSKALLVPTPGQTEQEYLATALAEDGQAVQQTQAHLALNGGIAAALQAGGLSSGPRTGEPLARAVRKVLAVVYEA